MNSLLRIPLLDQDTGALWWTLLQAAVKMRVDEHHNTNLDMMNAINMNKKRQSFIANCEHALATACKS